MKTLDERLKSVTEKIEILQNKRMRKRFIIRICWAVALIILALILFIPYETNVPDVSGYADSPYYSLIQYLNGQLCEKPAYANHSEWLAAKADQLFYWLTAEIKGKDTEFEDWALNPQTGFVSRNADELLGDLTGEILEGDLIHCGQFLYYLDGNYLKIYPIDKIATKPVLSRRIDSVSGLYGKMEDGGAGICLSADQKTLYVVAECQDPYTSEPCVGILTMDTSDPRNIVQTGRTFITGNLLSAQLDGEDILVTVQFEFDTGVDFGNESTYIPQIGIPGGMTSLPAEDIVLPSQLTDTCYTVICRLDGNDLQLQDSCALLSGSGIVKITEEYIYAAQVYLEDDYSNLPKTQYFMTELSVIRSDGNSMQWQKSLTMGGTVKSPDFLDPYEDILRVVTVELGTYNYGYSKTHLYCFSMKDWSVTALEEGVQGYTGTVRFNGDSLYLFKETKVTSPRDSVLVLDLSDPAHITALDTVPVDAYRSCLMNLGEYLVQISHAKSSNGVEIVVYQESENGLTGWNHVDGSSDYAHGRKFSQNRDAYLIDQENQIIGLGVYCYPEKETYYLLLQFDGSQLKQLSRKVISGDVDDIRAIVIDGYIYIFSDEIRVQKVS